MNSGLILVDKGAHLTSHAVVSYIRRTLNIKSVGHLGTLDPFATGLLPILIGGATKLADEIMSNTKQYLFTIKLGEETDTLDLTGQVIKTEVVPNDFNEKIHYVRSKFIGEIEQVPPAYSALKMNGRPLYEYMRSTGKLPFEIETKKRTVCIDSFEVVSIDSELKTLEIRVRCSKGTYVRSLARDIAYELGTVGCCVSLRREIVSPWEVNKQTLVISETSKPTQEEIMESLIAPAQMVCETIPSLLISSSFYTVLSSGNIFFLSKEADPLFFEQILNHKETTPSHDDLVIKVLIECKNNESSTMFLSLCDVVNENLCKIMPKKRIT